MMKATLNGKYESNANNGKASTTLSFNTAIGDAKLRASVTNALVLDSAQYSPPSFSFSLEKPDSFSVDYYPKKDANPKEDALPNVKFKLMNSLKVMEKTIRLTYSHAVAEKRAPTLDGLVEFNAENKLVVNHPLGTKDCKLKYTYTGGQQRKIVVEPSYDVATGAWEAALSRKFEGGDTVKASYKAAERTMGLEWSRDSKDKGTFKISTTLNMDNPKIDPKLMAESTWSYEL
ncbi:hypothetical protein Cni_G04164 [Canna indica]|uniref:Uncharacterized protein n=1 Tax=Canna indica TaxID=4628 RepID=A0AAQ3JT18_9LILI|nr:hypothetical protein Cni_G04164 [Canna indica]